MKIDLSSLNSSQSTAVAWQDGPLLVLAGPGSGKTQVLTYRVARLIEESPQARFRVLGVTFTNKAASEMRSRIDALLSEGRDRATLTTFHAFAAEILRQHGSHVGLKPDFGILSEQADREAVLGEAIKATTREREDDDFDPKAPQLLPIVTRMLEQCVRPVDARERLGIQPHARDVAAIYSAYRARLIALNQMDFGSLLALAVDLLENSTAIAKQIRRVYSYICVDEFQDTNAAQLRFLVRLVPESNPNLFVVADDDQLIYQWNGASPARLQDLRKQFQMQMLQLPENYRCPREVVDLANKLIRFNSDRAADRSPLVAHKAADGQGCVTVKSFDDFEEECRWLAKRLRSLPAGTRAQCVVLARRRKLLVDTVATLDDEGITAYVAIRKNEFQSAPYRLLHATLRLANAPQDREQLRRITRAFFELDGTSIEVDDVVARASLDQVGLLRAWTDVATAQTHLTAASKTFLKDAESSLVERLDYWRFVTLAHKWFTKMQGHPSESMSETAFDEFDDEKLIWESLKSEIAGHYQLADLSLHNFLQELDLRAKEKPAPKNAVRCLTIAACKGMEFKHVFLIGMVEDELPGYYARQKGDDSDEMREERRNCFVAITRAEESLTLTYADRYYGYTKACARFFSEMEIGISDSEE